MYAKEPIRSRAMRPTRKSLPDFCALRFLRINSEELVDKLDQFLHSEKKKYYEKELKPMSEETFGEMIDQAENDAENGRIVESGKHDELVAKGGLYFDLYQRQSLGFTEQ